MECEILNSILTSTVGTLFSPQLEVKGEATHGSKLEMRSSSESLAESNSGLSKSVDSLDAMHWIGTNGKKWLEDAMARLHVDYGKVGGKALAMKPVEELLEEKNKVKNELKKYDSNFMLLFRRQPGRAEKEPMRPLYVYYKKLKQTLSRCAHLAGRSKPAQHKHAAEQPGVKENAKVPEKKPSGTVKTFNEWTFKNNEEIHTKILELKTERGQLRTVLDKFQQDFVKAYNRKIKYNKDIAPVAGDFKRYKELKKTIVKLEELLK